MQYDLIIIGSGAAGLGAALYSGRYRIKTLVISKEFGGETAKAGTIENYPGVQAVWRAEMRGKKLRYVNSVTSLKRIAWAIRLPVIANHE